MCGPFLKTSEDIEVPDVVDGVCLVGRRLETEMSLAFSYWVLSGLTRLFLNDLPSLTSSRRSSSMKQNVKLFPTLFDLVVPSFFFMFRRDGKIKIGSIPCLEPFRARFYRDLPSFTGSQQIFLPS